ncbi:formimidoylglutamase [Halobacillus sp. BAB-2008]|uniref:formimidoylglutamase n=1 Tax=Halobacillus sp. BAB-2008 TaxID=1246484 RepID=UPI0002A4F45B|nr:formimidoylglutamase [Halobacillus sp. BAB-2008]ELK49095.1 formimidoylglutamase [Halobacillus sp. BAB-2008]
MSFRYVKPAGEAVFKDSLTTKMEDRIVPYRQGKGAEAGIIGLPLSKSSISPSTASEAPAAIRKAFRSLTTYASGKGDYAGTILDFGDVLMHPTDIDENIARLKESIRDMLKQEACHRYIILGGDHGISYPSIAAFQEKYGTIGVLQWDAHHDLRNLEDGGRTNGTPFRSLLEAGILKGEHLVQIGIRDYCNAGAYAEYGEEKGVHVYTMEEVERQGITTILQKEIARLKTVTDAVYLSVDMDVVDQAFAPGCPAAGPGGITSRELISSIAAAAADPSVKAMDLVENDPSKDIRDMTSRLAAYAMMTFLHAK